MDTDRMARWRRRITCATSPVPPGLVAGAHSGTVVAVKVLEEQKIVPPPRIGLHAIHPTEARTASVGADEEDRNKPLPQVGGDLVERDVDSKSGGILDRHVGSEELVVALKRACGQIVQRKPHGPTPIRIPAEHGRGLTARECPLPLFAPGSARIVQSDRRRPFELPHQIPAIKDGREPGSPGDCDPTQGHNPRIANPSGTPSPLMRATGAPRRLSPPPICARESSAAEP